MPENVSLKSDACGSATCWCRGRLPPNGTVAGDSVSCMLRKQASLEYLVNAGAIRADEMPRQRQLGLKELTLKARAVKLSMTERVGSEPQPRRPAECRESKEMEPSAPIPSTHSVVGSHSQVPWQQGEFTPRGRHWKQTLMPLRATPSPQRRMPLRVTPSPQRLTPLPVRVTPSPQRLTSCSGDKRDQAPAIARCAPWHRHPVLGATTSANQARQWLAGRPVPTNGWPDSATLSLSFMPASACPALDESTSNLHGPAESVDCSQGSLEQSGSPSCGLSTGLVLGCEGEIDPKLIAQIAKKAEELEIRAKAYLIALESKKAVARETSRRESIRRASLRVAAPG